MAEKYEGLIDYTKPTIDNNQDFDTPMPDQDLKDYSSLLQQPEEGKPKLDVGTEEVIKITSPEPFETAVRLTQGDIEYALQRFKGVSPEVAAKVKEISTKQDLDFDLIAQDKEKYLEYQQAEDIYNSLYETTGGDFSHLMPDLMQKKFEGQLETPVQYKYPKTIQYLENPENLIAAKDDVKALQELEETMRSWRRSEDPYYKTLKNSFEYGAYQAIEGLSLTPAVVESAVKSIGVDLLGLDRTKYSIKPSQILLDNSWLDHVEKLKQEVMPLQLEESVVQSVKDGNYLKAVDVALNKSISQAPNSLVAMIGAFTGNPMASLGIISSLSAGTAIKEKLEGGATPEQALTHSLISGTAEGLFESMGTLFILKGIEKRMAKEAGKFATKTFFKNLGRNALIAAPQNIVEEVLTENVQTFSDMITGNDEAFRNYADNMFETAIVAGVSGVGMSTTMYTANNYLEKIKANRNLATFDKAQETINQSKVPKQNIEEFLGEINLEKDTYVDNEKFVEYFQDEEEQFKELQKDMKLPDLSEIQQENIEVKLNTDKLLAKYSDSDFLNTLKPYMKFGEDGLSVKGVEDAEKIVAERIDDLIKVAEDMRGITIKDIPQLQAMKEQLVLSGVKAADADAQLNLQLANAQVLAPKADLTVEEWFNKINPVLNIGGEFVAREDQTRITYNQETGDIVKSAKQLEKGSFDYKVRYGVIAEEYQEIEKSIIKNTKSDYLNVYEKSKWKKDIIKDFGSLENLYDAAVNRNLIINKPKFKKWFGDSKVLNETEKPLVVYHGSSSSELNFFDKNRQGSNIGRYSITGFYFSDNQDNATLYAGDKNNVYPVYLSLKNPLIVNSNGGYEDSFLILNENPTIDEKDIHGYDFGKPFINHLDDVAIIAKKSKYDGVIVKNIIDGFLGGTTYIAFESTQIKSVENIGTFAVDDPNIFKQEVGEEAVTTNILNELKGKQTVSKQFIMDQTNRGNIKQAERDLIRKALEGEGKKVNVDEFIAKVQLELVPLKVIQADRYESVTLSDDLRGDIKDYSENIYESPIKTEAGDVHFSKFLMPNYFAHTRIEDMADDTTRRVIEVQSDLFQRGRLEKETGDSFGLSPQVLERLNPESKLEIGDTVKYEDDLGNIIEYVIDKNKNGYISGKLKAADTEVAKLQPYRNTYHERIIKEEVRRAAQDGIEKLQFPVGETAMNIEGLGETNFYKGKIDTNNPIYKFYEKDIQKYLKKNFDAQRIIDDKGVEWMEVDIKPEHIEAVTAFQEKDKTVRGSIQFTDTQTTINLFKSADRSTFLHESSHLFVQNMKRVIDSGIADEQLKADYDNLIKFAMGEKKISQVLDIKGQEKIARAMEAYFREGKAPSIKMANAFDRFKSWLTTIYETIKGLNVEINDEIRGIFDRMLSSKEDIESAKVYYNMKEELLNDIANANDKKQIKKKLKRTVEEAQRLELKRRMRAFEQSVGFTESNLKKAEQEVSKQKVYKTIDGAKEVGGMSFEKISGYITNVQIQKIEQRHKGLVNKKKGVDPLDVAEKAGYDRVEDMLKEIQEAENKKRMIKQVAKMQQQIIEQNILKDIKANEVVNGEESLHNDKSLEYLISEEKILLNKVNKKKDRKLKQKLKQIEMQALIDTAKEEILNKSVRDAVSYKKFLNAERNASDNTVKFLKEGNVEKALEYKKKQITNHVMVREAINYREIVLKNKKKYLPTNIKKMSAKLENSYNNIYINTLVDVKLIDEGKIKTSSANDLNYLETLNYNLFKTIPKTVLGIGANTNLNDLQMQTYLDLMDTLQSINKIGRDELSIIQTDKVKNTKELVNASVESMSNLKDYRQLSEKQSKLIKGVKVTQEYFLTRSMFTEFLFNRLDNYKADGVLNNAFEKLVDKEVLFTDLVKNASNKISKQLNVLDKFTRRINKQYKNTKGFFDLEGVEMPAFTKQGETIKDSWSAEKIISYVLNLGNKGNTEALENSYGFSQEQQDIITSQLTADELLAIQEIGNTIESFYPLLDEVHFKLYNRHMPKVERQKVNLKTADGTSIELDGWYYPLVYDNQINNRADEINDQKLLEKEVEINRLQAVIRSVNPKDGFTNSRSKNTGMPPNLSLSVLNHHISDVSLFISHSEILNDMNKLTLNKEWKSSFIQKQGKAHYEQLRDYLSSLSRVSNGTNDKLEKAIAYLNTKTTQYNLANIKVGVSQAFSMWHASKKLGAGYILKGFQQSGFVSGILGLEQSKVWDEIMKMSGYMRARADGWDNAMQTATSSLKGNAFSFSIAGKRHTFTKKDVTNFMFTFLKNRDRATVSIVWNGAMQKYLADNVKGRDITEADMNKGVKYADKIVRTTQPSALRTDLNAFQRDKRFWSLASRFMTYTFKFGNIMLEENQKVINNNITKKQYMNHIFQDILLPAISMGLLNSLWYDQELPEPKELVGGLLGFLISPLPIIRDISSVIKYRGKMGSLPAMTGFDMIVKLGYGLYQAGVGDKYIEDVITKDLVNFTEYMIGVPAVKNYRQIKKVFEGIEENF